MKPIIGKPCRFNVHNRCLQCVQQESYLCSIQTVESIFDFLILASSSGQLNLATENEEAPSSKYKKEECSCLMYFVDKNLIDNIYLASGALVNMNRVLSTRDFLGPYEGTVARGNLFVYPKAWRSNRIQIKRVVEIYIDHTGGSQIAVARVSNFS